MAHHRLQDAVVGRHAVIGAEDTVSADALDAALASPFVEAEVLVDGQPWAPPPEPECTHSAQLNIETVVAFIRDGDGQDLSLPVLDWQCRLRARCGECGRAFDIAPTGRIPRDGRPGVVVAMRPCDDPTI